MDVDAEQAVDRPVRVGISSCLLGSAVRFDGGHKRDPFLTGTFGTLVITSGTFIAAEPQESCITWQ